MHPSRPCDRLEFPGEAGGESGQACALPNVGGFVYLKGCPVGRPLCFLFGLGSKYKYFGAGEVAQWVTALGQA